MPKELRGRETYNSRGANMQKWAGRAYQYLPLLLHIIVKPIHSTDFTSASNSFLSKGVFT